MNYSKTNSESRMFVLEAKELFWSIIAQWKPIVVFSIALAIMVTAGKYYHDYKDYTAAQNGNNNAATTDESSIKSQDDILKGLSESDRLTVEYIIHQEQLIKDEEKYLNNSILLNTDPFNQRTLRLEYAITGLQDAEQKKDAARMLRAVVNDKDLINAVRELIDPDLDNRYIREILTARDTEETVLSIIAVLPESVEADDVENAINTAVNNMVRQCNSVMPFGVELISDNTYYAVNDLASNKKYTTISYINTLRTILNTTKSTLSSEQEEAYWAISNLQNNEQPVKEAVAISSPRPNAKIFVAGFILGVLIYIAVYVLIQVMSKRIYAPSDISYYYGLRCLGELYPRNKINKFIFSQRILDYHHKEKQDVQEQLANTAELIDSLCNRKGIQQLSVLCFGKPDSENEKQLNALTDAIQKKGKTVIIKSGNPEGENYDLLLENNETVLIASERDCTRIVAISKFLRIAESCNLEVLGAVYIG